MHMVDENYASGLERKLKGGVPIGAFVSDAIWLGGLQEARSHQPFVAIGPVDWDDEEELTFFKSHSEVEAFIQKLRAVSQAAFSDANANDE